MRESEGKQMLWLMFYVGIFLVFFFGMVFLSICLEGKAEKQQQEAENVLVCIADRQRDHYNKSANVFVGDGITADSTNPLALKELFGIELSSTTPYTYKIYVFKEGKEHKAVAFANLDKDKPLDILVITHKRILSRESNDVWRK